MAFVAQSRTGSLCRRIAPACIVLLLLLLCLQALHVHAGGDFRGATCLVCVSAQSSAPVALVFALVTLVPLSPAPRILDLATPTSEPAPALFIRPPPAF